MVMNMKQMKRAAVALILAAGVFLQMAAAAAQVAEEKPPETEGYYRAISELSALGLMNGYGDGSFGESEKMKRAELAVLLERLTRFAEKGETVRFRDVPDSHWAYGSISRIASAGLMEGDGNGLFLPEQPVRFEEAVKLLTELAAEAKGEDCRVQYPFGYIIRAAKWGITAGVDGAAGEYAPRGMIAKMLYNLLYLPQKDNKTFADGLTGVYYLSPQGNDAADGSYQSPWRSLSKAAENARSGETVILLAGSFYESANAVFDAERVTLYGRTNAEVKITYPSGYGIRVNADGVTFQNLHFIFGGFGDNASAEAAPFIECRGDGFRIADCGLSGFSVPVLFTGCGNAVMEGCRVENASVCVCAEDAENITLSGNAFHYPAKAGALLSGTEKVRFYNNTVRGEAEFQAGVILQSDTKDAVCWNNVIAMAADAEKAAGFALAGTERCRLYHNNVIGGDTAVRFCAAKNAFNQDTSIKNNIFMGCRGDAYEMEQNPQNMIADYNLFYGTYPKMMEPNSRFGNPWFVNQANDWRIGEDSPAAGAGVNLSAAETALDFTDRYGTPRGERSNIGAVQETVSGAKHETGESPSDGSVTEDFSGVLMNWDSVRGIWEVHDGVYMNTTTTGRNSALYRRSMDWTDFEYSADVRSPKQTKTACTGLIFRADAEMKNQYAIRIFANQYLEFVLWKNDSFESLAKFPFTTKPDTVYNLKVKAEGSEFTFYVDGKEVAKANDTTYASGAIGLYAYQQMYEYDNISARPIK